MRAGNDECLSAECVVVAAFVGIKTVDISEMLKKLDEANNVLEVYEGGGTRPAWTRGGRELIYLDGDNHVTAVSVETTESTCRPGPPQTLFTTAYATPETWGGYDVSPDGKRFLMIKEGAGPTEPAPSIVVVQNWLEELKRLVPAK